MKRIILFILLLMILLLPTLNARKVGVLKEISRPAMMEIHDNKLYIVDGAIIYIYSLDKLELINKFGKKGDGPGELQVFPFWPNKVSLGSDCIFVEGLYKIIYFTLEGELKKEQKKIKRQLKILPVGNNYVVKTFPFPEKDKKFYSAIKILNAKMEDVKELYREPVSMLDEEGLINMIPDSANFFVYEDKIFIEESPLSGFTINIYDSNGKHLYQIAKNENRIKVTEQDKEQAMDYLKESFQQKKLTVFVPIQVVESGWESFRKWAKLEYPKYLPMIQDIVVLENKLYVQTYKRIKDLEEYLILDMQGNILKRINLPQMKSAAMFDYQMLGLGIRYYDFYKNRFYYIEENEEEEEWELFTQELK